MDIRFSQGALHQALAVVLAIGCGVTTSACAVADRELSEDGADLATVEQGVAPALSAYNVDIANTSVSGLSSGAFFAQQMGVAFSSIIKGVGVVAGGTYDCAGEMAYFSCMYLSRPSVTTAVSHTKSWSGVSIDAYVNLASQKIYMFSGSSDTTVATSVMDQVYQYYVTTGSFVPAGNVTYKKDTNAAHTFPTDFDSTGNNACTTAGSPYISNCSFDGAGAILKSVYGALNARNTGALGGTLVQFNQSEFLANPQSYGMDVTGWLYVPAACASGGACKVHVAFHGCLQSYSAVGDKFIKNTGYNKWADTNNIIVLYPQTVADSINHNPSPSNAGANNNGCWDWVGYYGTDFDKKTGKQMAAIKKMLDRIGSGYVPGDGGGGGTVIPPAPTGLAAGSTTSSTVALSWSASADATSYDIYRNGSKANASDVTSTSYTDSGLAASTSYTYTVTAVNAAGASGSSNQVTATTTAAATCSTATNYAHVLAGRAHNALGYALANGSDENMGLNNIAIIKTLKMTGANYYVIGTCP